MQFLLEINAKPESFPGIRGKLRKTFTCEADQALERVKTLVKEMGGIILMEGKGYPVLLVDLPTPPKSCDISCCTRFAVNA